MQVKKRQPDGTFLTVAESFSPSSAKNIISTVRSFVSHLKDDDFWFTTPTEFSEDQEVRLWIKNFPQSELYETVYQKLMELKSEIPEMKNYVADVSFFAD